MRTLNIPLEESDFKIIEKRKGKRTWREFLLEGCCEETEAIQDDAGRKK